MSDDPKHRALELANIHGGGTAAEVVARASAYHAFLTGSGGGAPSGKPAAKPAAQPATQAAKPAAPAAKPAGTAAAKPAPQAAKPAALAAKPKSAAPPAQVGKYSIDHIRAIIQKVVKAPGLGKQAAAELLDTEGGVKRISDLKPADYDKVYEACENELSGGEAGAGETTDAATFDEDDPLG